VKNALYLAKSARGPKEPSAVQQEGENGPGRNARAGTPYIHEADSLETSRPQGASGVQEEGWQEDPEGARQGEVVQASNCVLVEKG